MPSSQGGTCHSHRRGDSLVAIGAGDHLVTGTLKRPGEEAAEGIVVFGKEDA